MKAKQEKHKYVVTVVVETNKKVTNKAVREYVESGIWLGVEYADGSAFKGRVRSVDFD